MTVYAKVTAPDNGYDHDQNAVKKLNHAEKYEVSDISIGRYHTSVCLKNVSGVFNSVNFTFYDEVGNEIDIFSMPEFNHYIQEVENDD